jgi:hypothetical protein
MVRWPAGLHPQAAKRNTSTFSWRPGFLGSGQQPIRAVPVGRYTKRISSVPLTGGQAQGIIPGVTGVSGSVTSPAPFFGLTGAAVIPVAGTYTVEWICTLAGTVGAGDANGFLLLLNNATLLATSVNAGAAGTYPQFVTATFNAGDFLVVFSGATPTAGAVYSAQVISQGQPLTLQVGPQGLGTTWYPLSVTISTTTGALDGATALVYLGPSATPATLQGTVFTGNGTVALAIPSMTPGQTVIVTWSGGHTGDTAAMNITGTMDALSTG